MSFPHCLRVFSQFTSFACVFLFTIFFPFCVQKCAAPTPPLPMPHVTIFVPLFMSSTKQHWCALRHMRGWRHYIWNLFTRNYKFVEYIQFVRPIIVIVIITNKRGSPREREKAFQTCNSNWLRRWYGINEHAFCACIRNSYSPVWVYVCVGVFARIYAQVDGTIDGATSNREQEAKLVAFINRHFSIY